MKKKVIVGVIISGVVLAGFLLVTAKLYPTNVEDTSPNHEDEKLRTRRYQTVLPNFAAETEKIIPQITSYGQAWKYISTDLSENSAVIKTEVPVVVFTDDLQIRAEKDPANGGIIVNIHSNSRVGKSDFGENRRHLVKILEALDKQFKR